MFGKSKGDAAEEDRDVGSAQEVQRSTATPGASEAISSISSGLSIVGKIVGHGAVTIFGHVEGELHASTVVIAEGAQVEGDVVAEELTISGHVEGTIHANRVKLNSTAVVDGDIFHQSLAVEENARSREHRDDWKMSSRHRRASKRTANSPRPGRSTATVRPTALPAVSISEPITDWPHITAWVISENFRDAQATSSRFGSKADISLSRCHVRYAPNNGHRRFLPPTGTGLREYRGDVLPSSAPRNRTRERRQSIS